MPIKAICFDLDDTLVDRAAALRRYAEGFVERWGEADEGRRKAAVDEIVQADHWGYIGRSAFFDWLGRRFPHARPLNELQRRFASDLARCCRRCEARLRLVERLGRRLRLAVVANGRSATQRETLQAVGLADLFRNVLISGEIGVSKPDPEIFRRALAMLRCRADETLMIGDRWDWDVAPAGELGFQLGWVSLGRPLPEHATRRPQVVVEDLSQPAALEAWLEATAEPFTGAGRRRAS